MNAPRSGCPTTPTLEALGDRWRLIVRDLMSATAVLPRVADPGDPEGRRVAIGHVRSQGVLVSYNRRRTAAQVNTVA